MCGGAIARGRSSYLALIARALTALALTASPAAADPDPGPSADELERVFKNYHRAERALVALVIDGAEAATDGPIVLELGRPGIPPSVPAAPVLAALTPRLRPETGAALDHAVRGHRLALDALRAAGLAVAYEPHRLELRIDVPPRLTRRLSHDLGAGAPPGASDALAPAAASGYVNVRAGASTDGALDLQSDEAINVDRWVLQGRADVTRAAGPGAAVTGHRGDVLLVRDLPASAVRFMAGDFAVLPAGLQASYPLLGVAVGRDFSLQPYRVIRPIGSFDFLLERAARVTVLVNGTPVHTLSLPAGRHDVRDLPLTAGVNDIELLIRDGAGSERRIAFSLANPDALLAPGLVQFSLSGGAPLGSDAGMRSYELARPVASGRLRVGVTRRLTLGGAFDGDRDLQVGGVAATIATGLGRLSLDAGASRAPVLGYAAGARCDYLRSADGTTTMLAITGHAYARQFRTLGPQAVRGETRGDLGIVASRPLGAALLGRLDLRYELGRDVRDAQSVLLGVSRGFGGLAIDASVSVNHGAHDETRLFVTAHWALPDRATVHTASRASSVSGLSNEITYSGRSASSPGGVAASVTLSEDPGDVGTAASMQYTGNRFTTALEGHATFDRAGRITTDAASLEAATALAFVGGRATLSRPITGSFVMIERHPALDGTALHINPSPDGYAAEADWLARAVVPNLEPYRIGRIAVEAPELPPGSSLGPASFTVLPAYRSGTLISVGEAGTVCATGILLHYNGEPVSDAIVELISVGQPRRAQLLLMTNRAGRFSVTGLDPGRYALRLSGDRQPSGELVIPPGVRGVYAARIIEVP